MSHVGAAGAVGVGVGAGACWSVTLVPTMFGAVDGVTGVKPPTC
jgi:hypothetical protein